MTLWSSIWIVRMRVEVRCEYWPKFLTAAVNHATGEVRSQNTKTLRVEIGYEVVDVRHFAIIEWTKKKRTLTLSRLMRWSAARQH